MAAGQRRWASQPCWGIWDVPEAELNLLPADMSGLDAIEPDGSFDFAISEYSAVLWCDPYRWVPAAHRLLRPGGTAADASRFHS